MSGDPNNPVVEWTPYQYINPQEFLAVTTVRDDLKTGTGTTVVDVDNDWVPDSALQSTPGGGGGVSTIDAVVYKDGTEAVTVTDAGETNRGTDHVDVLQTALDNNVAVYVREGTYDLESNDTLTLGDNATFVSDGAYLQANTKDTTGTDTASIRCVDGGAAGNDNITLSGFEIDGAVEITAGSSNFCENIEVTDIFIKNVNDFAFVLKQCDNFYVSDIRVNNSGAGSNAGNDGVHVIDSKHGQIHGVYGDTGDDILAFETQSRECFDVSATGIHGTTDANGVKFFANSSTGAGDDVHDIHVDGVTVHDAGGGIVGVDIPGGGSGEVRDVSVSNASGRSMGRGMNTSAVDTSRFNRMTLQNVTVDGATGVGFWLEGSGHTLVNCKARDVGTSGGIQALVLSCTHSQVYGGQFGPCTDDSIEITDADCTVVGAYCPTGGSGNRGVVIDGARASVIGCRTDAPNNWAMDSTANATNALVALNTFLSSSATFTDGSVTTSANVDV